MIIRRLRSGEGLRWCVLLLAVALWETAANSPSAYDYYDQLRFQPDLLVESDPSSSILQVQLNSSAAAPVYRLAELKCFLPLTDGGTIFRSRSLDDVLTVLLAVDHFNNPDRSPGIFSDSALRQEGCNLRLTAQILDTQYNALATAGSYLNLLPTATTVQDPPPAAVVGAWRSAVTLPLGVMTGVSATPHVSWTSTATDFDNKEQFPYFGRTITSTMGEAEAALRYFQTIGSTHVAVIYVADLFGSSMQKSFTDAAASAGIQTASIPLSFEVTVGSEEAKRAMEELAALQYRHIFCIVFDVLLEPVAQAARDSNLLGPDYFYAFTGPDVNDLEAIYGNLNHTSPLADLLHGAGIVQMQGGVRLDSDNDVETTQDLGFQKFLSSWNGALQEDTFMEYAASKFPSALDNVEGFERQAVEFSAEPGGYRPFLYDAVFALGSAMCRAGKSATFFDGSEIMEHFRTQNTTGASGHLDLDNTTGTRDFRSITFVIWNIRREGDIGLNFYPASRLSSFFYEALPGNTFLYADGTQNPPGGLPPPKEEFNYIGTVGRVVGFGMAGFTIVSAIFCLIWLYVNQKSRIVFAAQPLFLVLVAVGSTVTSLALIPLSAEEISLDSSFGLDAACRVAPWLYVIGTTITLSALLSKTSKVYKAYFDPSLEYIEVSFSDIGKVVAILLPINITILTLWTVLAPLEWTRTYRGNMDIFLRVTESYGECAGDSSEIFALILLTVNFGFICLGNYQSAVTRHVETEFHESHFVSLSLFSMLQAWLMGLAILTVTYSDTQARFFVLNGIVIISSISPLLLTYIPKMVSLRELIKKKGRKRAFLDQRTPSSEAARLSASQLDVDTSEGQNSEGGDDTESDSQWREGTRITHNPQSARNLLAGGGQALSRRELQIFMEEEEEESESSALGTSAGSSSANKIIDRRPQKSPGSMLPVEPENLIDEDDDMYRKTVVENKGSDPAAAVVKTESLEVDDEDHDGETPRIGSRGESSEMSAVEDEDTGDKSSEMTASENNGRGRKDTLEFTNDSRAVKLPTTNGEEGNEEVAENPGELPLVVAADDALAGVIPVPQVADALPLPDSTDDTRVGVLPAEDAR